MENKDKKTIRDKILEEIKSGQIRMRPRWQFVLRAMLYATATVIAILVILFLASFVVFATRQNGLIFAPGFGPRGWFAFIRSLPWMLVAFTLLFVALLELLVRHYAFAYRKPFLYSVVGVVLLVLIGGFVLAQTSFHRQFLNSARLHREPLPFIGDFYRGFGMERFGDIRPGVVISTTSDGFVIQDRAGETSSVSIVSSTRIAPGIVFNIGDRVVIFGDRSTSGTINAEGIRDFPDRLDD